MKQKIKIKHSAYLILPIIALLLSIFGAIICFNEGLAGAIGWNPIFWLITIFAIPIFAIILGIFGVIISLLIDYCCNTNISIYKFWIPLLIISTTTPFWTPFTISSMLYFLGTQIYDKKIKIENSRPVELPPQPAPKPKTPYHCESKVTPDGIQTFCVGNPEDK